jgi:hypothetical protein
MISVITCVIIDVAMKLKVEGSSEYFEDREGHIIPRNLPQKARPPKRIPCFFCWKKRWGEELVWDPMVSQSLHLNVKEFPLKFLLIVCCCEMNVEIDVNVMIRMCHCG